MFFTCLRPFFQNAIYKFSLYIFLGDKKTLVEQLDDLKDELNEIDEISQNIDITATKAQKIAMQGQMSIDEAEKVLDKIYEQLSVSF